MNIWPLLPLTAAGALVGAIVVAIHRKGSPAGRSVFALSATAMALPIIYIAVAQWQPAGSIARLAAAGADLGLLAFPALWLALAFRFGREGAGLGRLGAPLVVLVGITSLGLLLAGACGLGAARTDLPANSLNFEIRGLATRALLGQLLLAGASGVVLFQAFWESARRAAKPRLRRASAGFLLASLGIFLVAGQALLYGGVALHILSLATLCALPVALAAVPVFRAGRDEILALPDRARCGVSSGVLMGLGVFLIALAVLGEAIEKLAPAGRLLWFHWGGTILVGGFAAVWLVPGLRGRLRIWFRVPVLPARYDWDWRPLLSLTGQKPAAAPILAAAAGLFEENLGRVATALWIRSEDPPGYGPWSTHGTALPFLRSDNPLTALFDAGVTVVDFTEPPQRLARVAAYVENLELVERQGFRLFVALSSGSADFGILAFAPRDRQASGNTALALEFAAGPLAAVVWGALLASAAAGAPVSAESWMRTVELMHRAAEDASAAIPDRRVGERIAAWAAACAETCAERAGAAVGRSPSKPIRGGALAERRTGAPK